MLKKLTDSARKVIRPIGVKRPGTGKRGVHVADTTAAKSIEAEVAAQTRSGEMYPKADRGSNAVEVFGSAIVRPSMLESSRFGRSPLLPSTLPEPGPSEPVITRERQSRFRQEDAGDSPSIRGTANHTRAGE